LYVGIRELRLGNRVEDVGNAIQNIPKHMDGVVRELVGHGLGQKCMKIQMQIMVKGRGKLLSKVWWLP
jgi:methionyl aminopeptidase